MIDGVFDDVTDFLPPSVLRERGVDYASQLSSRIDSIAAREGRKLGEYATTSGSEYFAESFVAFIKGDVDKVHPDLIDIFRKVTK